MKKGMSIKAISFLKDALRLIVISTIMASILGAGAGVLLNLIFHVFEGTWHGVKSFEGLWDSAKIGAFWLGLGGPLYTFLYMRELFPFYFSRENE